MRLLSELIDHVEDRLKAMEGRITAAFHQRVGNVESRVTALEASVKAPLPPAPPAAPEPKSAA